MLCPVGDSQHTQNIQKKKKTLESHFTILVILITLMLGFHLS